MQLNKQERCKVMLDKLLARMDEQGRKMDDMISSLAATTSRLLGAAADSTPISTATNKVPAVANAAPSADATLTDQAHIRCSRSGLDTNAGDLHIVATFNPKMGVSMVAPAPVEHSSTPSSKPFSTIKHDMQELLVIDDLLSALVGIEGRYISIKRIRGKEGYVVFQIDSSVDFALQDLTRRIFPLCEDFVLVSQFVESRSHFKNGLVNHALAAALRAFLLDYQAMVAQREHQFRLGRLSVQGLWSFCQRMMSSLNALAVLVEKAISNNTSGSATLNLIQSQAKAMAGDNVVRSLLEKMTECASAAYLRMLERWVYEGVIDDPYGEFFIAENKSRQKESLTQDYDAKYWQQRYSLKEGIPSFLTNIAATILATGKYLNVMRECGHNVQVFLSENSKLMSFGSNHQYLECIKSVYDFASGVDQVSSSHLRFSCCKFSGFLADNVEGIMSTLMVFLLAKELQMPWDPGDAKLNNMDSRCFAIVKLPPLTLANSKSQLARSLSALGELSISGIPDKTTGTIKEQLAVISPFLEQLCRKKEKRTKEFADVQLQIQTIRGEIAGSLQVGDHLETPHVDEDDLSMKKLNEFLFELQALQKEKSNRLHKILEFVSSVHDLCSVLGMDFLSTVTEVHPSLNDSVGVHSKSISDETLSKLSKMVTELEEEKIKRLEKIQALASQLTDLWNLMDTTVEERQLFHHVTCNMSSTLDEVTVPGALALDVIEQAELEVERLDQLKASRMKDIAFKRQTELEDIYAQAHIAIDTSAARDRIMSVIDSSSFEPSELLADMENQILKAKEEALSRKDILEKVDRWMLACEEESWLEDYSRDDNRYSATRGAHLNLKRAEKARVLVNKIPAIVDMLVAKTQAWEQEHSMSFTYDGVALLAMLDEYKILRQEKEEEKRRMRDQKKINEQLAAEQGKLFGSKPSPARPQSSRKASGPRAVSAANGTPNRRLSVQQNGARSASRDGWRDSGRPAAPVNYVAISKEDAVSQVSSNNPPPSTP